MAKRVLFVAYYFPPMGGAGVQRSVKFVRYLPEFGWSPVVVTADASDYEVTREFQLDEALAAELGGPVSIHRVHDPRVRGFLRKLDRSRARITSRAAGPVISVNGILQTKPPDKAHGVKGPSVLVFAQSVDRYDPRVFQTAGDLGFSHEPLLVQLGVSVLR